VVKLIHIFILVFYTGVLQSQQYVVELISDGNLVRLNTSSGYEELRTNQVLPKSCKISVLKNSYCQISLAKKRENSIFLYEGEHDLELVFEKYNESSSSLKKFLGNLWKFIKKDNEGNSNDKILNAVVHRNNAQITLVIPILIIDDKEINTYSILNSYTNSTLTIFKSNIDPLKIDLDQWLQSEEDEIELYNHDRETSLFVKRHLRSKEILDNLDLLNSMFSKNELTRIEAILNYIYSENIEADLPYLKSKFKLD